MTDGHPDHLSHGPEHERVVPLPGRLDGLHRSGVPGAPATGGEGRHRVFDVALAAALVLGASIRAWHIFAEDFPLSDGGMFYAMVRDLQAAGYRLPVSTSYNFLEIPYAYPPLGFYAAALLDDLTPLTLIDIFRFLPLVVTILTLAAFFLLARSMLKSRLAGLAAVVAFAVLPRSFVWLLMGGGLTRSFGFLFAILALYQVHLLYTRRSWRYAVSATVFSALTVLSHLGTAPFLAFSIVLFFLTHGRHRHGVLSSVAVALGTIVLTAPWWVTVMAHHGVEPFLAARATGGSFFSDPVSRRSVVWTLARLGTSAMGETFFPLVSAIALLGALVSLTRVQLLLPAWWLVILVLEERAGGTYATLPVAMLAGYGVAAVMVPLLTRPGEDAESKGRVDAPPAQRGVFWPRSSVYLFRTSLPALVLGFLILYTTASALVSDWDYGGDTRFLEALTAKERAAMRWVSEKTPATSRFLVFGGSGWAIDKVGEWFPVLAERESIATVQGTEWFVKNGFIEKEAAHTRLQECNSATTACIDEWAESTRASFTHVYVTRTCCRALIESLAKDPTYDLVYDDAGAAVFAVSRDGTMRAPPF